MGIAQVDNALKILYNTLNANLWCCALLTTGGRYGKQ